VAKSKKNENQYVGVFDMETATQYSLCSKIVDFSGAPVKVPVKIDAVLSPRQFSGKDGSPTTVLYVDQASFKTT